ncbi:MAG: RagB/SusD family nutrient uptake outer membrane protein [Chitinophagaceae bacterium]
MKRIYINLVMLFAILIVGLTGCKKILDETSKSTYTSEYFKTEAGITGAITYLYYNLRYYYGNGYFLDASQTGTDESTYGTNSSGIMDMSGTGSLTGSNSNANTLWTNAFVGINTANGVIEYGYDAGVESSVIAEAHFFRAFYYFMLVQTFGGVPLDLGSGDLLYNTSSSQSSTRNTVSEVYTEAIFPDLDSAIANLPVAGRVTGGVTQTLARLYLAKAYLTYAWWLENPNNIPTYPTADRTDPDGHNAAWYYQEAYDVASEAINNPGSFGLQSSFYQVNVATNDRNSEILLYADHSLSTQYGGLSSTSYSSGSSPDNFGSWFEQFNYPLINSSITSDWSSTLVNSVQRQAIQDLGRPWYMIAPPLSVFTTTFSDKVNDSRYDGTFTLRYRCNMDESGLSDSYSQLYNANGLAITEGDAVLTFLNNDTTDVDYSNTTYASNIGAGTLSGSADYVVEPSKVSRILYPGNWKIGPYRTDNGTGLGEPNAGSTRPWNIAKFSELFFIAAEAAVKGATTSAISGTYANDGTARGLINVIRARAGVWSYSRYNNEEVSEDYSAEMIAATPSTITIAYILAERSREYYGEGYRWYDLVRTQQWTDLAGTYTIGTGASFSDHSTSTVTRTLTSGYYLRPIPQTQIDALDLTDAEKTAYQNPQYQE